MRSFIRRRPTSGDVRDSMAGTGTLVGTTGHVLTTTIPGAWRRTPTTSTTYSPRPTMRFLAPTSPPRDIISTYAGLRALVAPEDEKTIRISRDGPDLREPSGPAVARRWQAHDPSHVAERIVDLVAHAAGTRGSALSHAEHAVARCCGIATGAALDQPAQTREEHLRWRYGALAAEVSAIAHGDERLGRRLAEDCGDLPAEVGLRRRPRDGRGARRRHGAAASRSSSQLARRRDARARGRRGHGATARLVARTDRRRVRTYLAGWHDRAFVKGKR